MMKRRLLTLVLVFMVIGVVSTTFAPSTALAGADPQSRAQRAERRYFEGMMDHHQMAVDMSTDCLKKAKTQDVLTLCQNIIDAQTKEIKQLHDWLLDWYNVDYNPMSMSHMMGMMGMSHDGAMMGGRHMGGMMGGNMGGDMGGMMDGSATAEAGDHPMQMPDDMPMMMGMMAGLNKLSGTEYEIAWLEAMIDHHDDAVHMSERLLKHVDHQDLATFAQKVIDDQSKEIESMEALLKTFGTK
jgi:uncharacterized protein (DUF305 family)